MAKQRTPTNILELKGAFKKDPKRKRARMNEPNPARGVGRCPKSLTLENPEYKKIWDLFVKNSAPKVMTCSDVFALSMLVRIEYEARTNFENMSDAKITQHRLLLGTFGLTPADRSKINIQTPNDKGCEFDGF